MNDSLVYTLTHSPPIDSLIYKSYNWEKENCGGLFFQTFLSLLFFFAIILLSILYEYIHNHHNPFNNWLHSFWKKLSSHQHLPHFLTFVFLSPLSLPFFSFILSDISCSFFSTLYSLTVILLYDNKQLHFFSISYHYILNHLYPLLKTNTLLTSLFVPFLIEFYKDIGKSDETVHYRL